ncbi:MAG: sugar ABC transporter substrate-binding protein [Spirochaetes bacterium]|nr:sugar ABC transporter substrate-binding protein [Spirochaetota bacterium]
MKKRILAIFLCMALSMVFVGNAFARGSAQAARPQVAIVLKTLASPYWQSVLAGAREAAAIYGFDLIELGPPSEDHVIEQINMMEDIIARGVSGIVFAPSQPPAAVGVLNMARSAGIPVAVIDTPMPDGFDTFLTFIGSNNYEIGALGAQEMMRYLSAGDTVTILEGAPGNVAMTLRSDGAENVFRANGVVIQSRQPAFSDREQAFSIMQNVLQLGPVDGVFAANDDQAVGALLALTQNNMTAVVMGVDGNSFAIESVRDGGLFGTVAQDAAGMGFLGVQSIYRYLNNLPVERHIDAPTPVITRDNVTDHL